MDRFTNQTAIVTGASSGIGRETALQLGAEGAGVVLAARRLERLADVKESIEKAGGSALCVAADVTKPEDCAAVAAAAILFFASPAARAVTGQYLVVDHGCML